MRNRAVETPESRKKQRIGGGLLLAGIAVNMIALLIPLGSAHRGIAFGLFGLGVAFVAASLLYMILTRRAS